MIDNRYYSVGGGGGEGAEYLNSEQVIDRISQSFIVSPITDQSFILSPITDQCVLEPLVFLRVISSIVWIRELRNCCLRLVLFIVTILYKVCRKSQYYVLGSCKKFCRKKTELNQVDRKTVFNFQYWLYILKLQLKKNSSIVLK